MFAKKDYREYFESIEQKEKNMLDFLNKTIPHFDDRSVIRTLTAVRDDEIIHCSLAKKLFTYL